MRLIISQKAISKSICGNLNRRLKKRGMRTSFRRDGVVEPKLEPPVGRGSDIWGFIVKDVCAVNYGVGNRKPMRRMERRQKTSGVSRGFEDESQKCWRHRWLLGGMIEQLRGCCVLE
jgi:hypothetical protein